MAHHLLPGVRQHNTHEELVGQAKPPATLFPARALDAIIVPASRPAEHLEHAVKLARAGHCRLVVLCSREARADEVKQLLAARSLAQAVVIDLPGGYGHRWLEFATSRAEEIKRLPEVCATRDTDLSIKRNLGLILARMLGWDRVFFMDDDIRDIQFPDLRRTVSMLGQRYYSVGMRVTDFPDNSVVCHAHRETGESQDVFVSGSALAIDCTAPIGFFPDVYNEDWLFFYNDTVERRLACSGLRATQLSYDPFDDPRRAAGQEFGDVLAEGLYALLHRGRNAAHATRDYWINFLDARRRFLDAIIARADRAQAEVREKMLDSVRAARECSAEIHPEYCEHYVQLWRKDLSRWEQTLKEIPQVPSITKALSELGLAVSGGDSGGRPSRQIPVEAPERTVQALAPIPDIATIATLIDLRVDSTVLPHLNAMAADAAERTLRQSAIPPSADMAAAAAAASAGKRLADAVLFVLLVTFLGPCLAVSADIAARHRRISGEPHSWRRRSLQVISAPLDAARTLSTNIRWPHLRGVRTPTSSSL